MTHVFKYYTNKWNSFDFDKSNLNNKMTWDDFDKLSKNDKLKLIQINKNKSDFENSTYTLSTKKDTSNYLSKWYDYNKKLTDVQIKMIDEYLKQTNDINNNREIIQETQKEINKLIDESKNKTDEIMNIKKQIINNEEKIEKNKNKINDIQGNSVVDTEDVEKNEIELENLLKENENMNKKIEELKTIEDNLDNENKEILNKINEYTNNINRLEDQIIQKYKKQDLSKYDRYKKIINELNVEYADVVNIGAVNELNIRNILNDLDYIKTFEINAQEILKNPPKNFKELPLKIYLNCGLGDSEYCRKFRIYGIKKFINEKNPTKLEKSYENYNNLGFLDDVSGYTDGIKYIDQNSEETIYTKKQLYQLFLGDHEYQDIQTIINFEIGKLDQKSTINKKLTKNTESIETDLYLSNEFQTGEGIKDWFSKKVKQTDFDPLKKDFEKHVINDDERIKNLEHKIDILSDRLNDLINKKSSYNPSNNKPRLNFINDISKSQELKHINKINDNNRYKNENDTLESKLKDVLDKRRLDIEPDEESEESEDWGEGLKELISKSDKPMFIAGLLGELKKDLENYGIALNLSKDGQSYYLNVFNRNKKNNYGKGIIEAEEIKKETEEPTQITYSKLKKIYGDAYN